MKQIDNMVEHTLLTQIQYLLLETKIVLLQCKGIGITLEKSWKISCKPNLSILANITCQKRFQCELLDSGPHAAWSDNKVTCLKKRDWTLAAFITLLIVLISLIYHTATAAQATLQ
jgi:hypothetical protein